MPQRFAILEKRKTTPSSFSGAFCSGAFLERQRPFLVFHLFTKGIRNGYGFGLSAGFPKCRISATGLKIVQMA
jgi:hypothetical protein